MARSEDSGVAYASTDPRLPNARSTTSAHGDPFIRLDGRTAPYRLDLELVDDGP